MIKPLSKFLSTREIEKLICNIVFDSKEDISILIEKIKRERSYEVRKNSHAVNSRKLVFNDDDIEKIVWNYFIRRQLDEGKTTGELSKELNKPLAFINSFF